MTILERLGRGLMLAIATPIMFAEEVLSTRDDVAHEREARAKAEGERDEARRNAISMHAQALDAERDRALDASRIVQLEGEVTTLRSELDSAATDDEQYHHTAATLQDRTRERDALLNASANHAAEVNTLRARIRELEEKADRLADVGTQLTSERDIARNEARALRATNETLTARLTASTAADEKPAADKCAWCLGDATQTLQHGPGGKALHTCDNHYVSIDVFTIADRVTMRAASCPSRRVADPLSVACDDCGASLGEACSAASRSIDA